MPDKQLFADVANGMVVSGFAITLSDIDTVVSIAVGCVALVAAVYSIIWHKVRIAQAKRKDDEQSQ